MQCPLPLPPPPAVGAIVYGYGGNEDESPLKDTVDLLDKLVKEYVAGMVRAPSFLFPLSSSHVMMVCCRRRWRWTWPLLAARWM